MRQKSLPSLARICCVALFLVASVSVARAQVAGSSVPTPTPAPPTVKAAPPQPDERADGVATLPIRFIDYLAFPDRERTEFRGRGVRSIQTYSGDRGWLLDGMKQAINDATPEQVGDFRLAMRTSLDNVLRGWWRAGGAKIEHAGRR